MIYIKCGYHKVYSQPKNNNYFTNDLQKPKQSNIAKESWNQLKSYFKSSEWKNYIFNDINETWKVIGNRSPKNINIAIHTQYAELNNYLTSTFCTRKIANNPH